MRLALDATGGDYAPRATVDGALLAVKQASEEKLDDFHVCLLGSRRELSGYLPEDIPAGLEFIETPAPTTGTTAPDAPPPEAPIVVQEALSRLSSGEFDAVVSAGSTADQVTASIEELGRCAGITRPAVGALLPTAAGRCILLDVGASLTASPHHLVQFAVMGLVYMQEIAGVENPRIAVLNVAREPGKGEPRCVEAHRLLAESGLNFTGFIEGREIPRGDADVVVTNGFTGNALLKYTEGMPALLEGMLGVDSHPGLREQLAAGFDFDLRGGEPLLGVRGVSIICHGASSQRGISASLMQAYRMASIRLHEKIEAFLLGKFSTFFSKVKYLRSFRMGFRSLGTEGNREGGKTWKR